MCNGWRFYRQWRMGTDGISLDLELIESIEPISPRRILFAEPRATGWSRTPAALFNHMVKYVRCSYVLPSGPRPFAVFGPCSSRGYLPGTTREAGRGGESLASRYPAQPSGCHGPCEPRCGLLETAKVCGGRRDLQEGARSGFQASGNPIESRTCGVQARALSGGDCALQRRFGRTAGEPAS